MYSLPRKCGKYTYGYANWWKGFMKYANEMGLSATIYKSGLIKTGWGIQKLMGVDTQQGDLISLLLFFKNKETRPKNWNLHGRSKQVVSNYIGCYFFGVTTFFLSVSTVYCESCHLTLVGSQLYVYSYSYLQNSKFKRCTLFVCKITDLKEVHLSHATD
jgi:hypothetical protein